MPLSDEESIDRVNPFVQHDFYMPGTSRQIIDFSRHVKVEDVETFDDTYVSPASEYAKMINGRILNNASCTLSRPIYPGRNIQYDEIYVNSEVKNQNTNDLKRRETLIMNVLGAVSLFLLIAAL